MFASSTLSLLDTELAVNDPKQHTIIWFSLSTEVLSATLESFNEDELLEILAYISST